MASPLMTALMDVFPNSMRAIAAHTLYGSQKHNPGGMKHWAFHVSANHADAAIGHLMERGNIDTESGSSHSVAAAWRALANLETELIEKGAKPGRSVDFERGAPKPTAYEVRYAFEIVQTIVDDPDLWYTVEVSRMKDRAPA